MGIVVNNKLIGIVLTIMLSVILIESYFLFNQPKQNLNLTKDTFDSTSSIAPSSSLDGLSKSSDTTINQVDSEVTFIPTIPEFTVAYIDASYDVPTTYSTDSYTGKQVVHEGYHVARTAIEIKIKNQPFTPYTNSNGEEIKFYYNVRTKGHYTDDWGMWGVVWHPEQMQTQSNSEYTVILFLSENGHEFSLNPAPRMLEISPDGQIDIQVKALVGIPYEGSLLVGIPDSFWGKESDWSTTQTLTIP